jgi:hypothetical protein
VSGKVPPPASFDPYRVLAALDEARVWCILIGGIARVLQGSDEVTRGVDLTPSPKPEGIERLAGALVRLDAAPRNGATLADAAADPEGVPLLAYDTAAGEVKVVVRPAGTRGYEDLRWKAQHLHVGDGLRPHVAAPGDLVRMLEALERPAKERSLEAMRRVVELDRGMGLER